MGGSEGGNLFEPFWTFPHCRFPSPSIHPLFSLPVLDSTQDAVFPPLLSLFSPSLVCFTLAPLSAYVWWCQCSRTPPLTDSSLDGTLLRTVQCTANSATRSTRFVVDKNPSPFAREWYLLDGGRGETMSEGFVMRVDCTMWFMGN